MVFLKKKGIKLSEYNLFTIINLAHHNHVIRVNPHIRFCFFFFFFSRRRCFLVFFSSLLFLEKKFQRFDRYCVLRSSAIFLNHLG